MILKTGLINKKYSKGVVPRNVFELKKTFKKFSNIARIRNPNDTHNNDNNNNNKS